MGLEINSANFLLSEKQRGAIFTKTLTLGRQEIHIDRSKCQSFLEGIGLADKDVKYADNFFTYLGAAQLDFMDASDYEGASVIHNLNNPLNESLKCKYDVVIDGGTLEHIFNFPTAIKSCMEMVKPGGNLILMTPWHNWAGHGFYEFSPELFYNVLSLPNGYSVERMLVVQKGRWHSVANPSDIGGRVEVKSLDPLLLFISAKRVEVKPIFSDWPQQSDYSTAWGDGVYGLAKSTKVPGMLGSLVKILPSVLKPIQKSWRILKHYRSLGHPFADQNMFAPIKSPNGVPYTPESDR